LPTGLRVIGPGAGGAGSRSAPWDFVQYIAQGDPLGSSAAWKTKDPSNDAIATTKSQRGIADIQAPLGRATTRSLERVAATVGMLNGAAIEFELVKDVPEGGVLFGLPALLLLGLREMFWMPEGLLSAGKYLSTSGAHGPGTYSFARSVALCGAGRMGQADRTRIAPRSAHHICAEITATETVFTGSDLRLTYEISAHANSMGTDGLSLGVLCPRIFTV
jgi:hypothetical protein